MTAPLRHLSICSGIGAPDLAWSGWLSDPLAFAEIEPFPSAALAHRFPGVPNLGDMTKWPEWPREMLRDADILVGGTPCQSFSVAGARAGLGDARGNLTLTYAELADAIDDIRRAAGKPACWHVWENVPGVLSDDGNAFGDFLGRLCGGNAAIDKAQSRRRAGLVMGPRRCVAWRVFDAKYFGVAQRRRRVFVLARGYSGTVEWGPANALLPIGESCAGLHSKNKAPPEGFADAAAFSIAGDVPTGDGGPVTDANRLSGLVAVNETLVFGGNRQTGPIDQSPALLALDGHGRRGFEREAFVVSAQPEKQSESIAFSLRGRAGGVDLEVERDACAPALRAASGGASRSFVAARREMIVRRLTETECERLQGFPDGWTDIPWRAGRATAGHRYKACGNSWAVPCGRYVGERIAAVDPRCAVAAA